MYLEIDCRGYYGLSDSLRSADFLNGGLTQTKVLTCFASPGFFIDCSLKQASVASIKKSRTMCRTFLCARDWIRTSTPFPAPPPQGGLSTNFNTRAPLQAAILKYFSYILSGTLIPSTSMPFLMVVAVSTDNMMRNCCLAVLSALAMECSA